MKLQDRITIGISFLALVVSIASAVHDWLVEHQADVKREQGDVYNAYQLGQSTAVIWAYEKASQTGPPVNGETQAQIGNVQVSLWTFKAQGYAEYFKLTAERFQDFLTQVKRSDAQGTSGAFEELDSTIQVESGRKAVAAYDLGWQTTVFGIESAANVNSQIVSGYPTVRDHLNGDLKTIGVRYSFPATIASRDEFIASVKAAKGNLDRLQP
jgi:hypothetical protein